MRAAERGDIWMVDLNPVKGSEEAGRRPVLVLTRRAFNVRGVCLVSPITQGGGVARSGGFAASLTGAGTQTQGVVLCDQLRTIALRARAGQFIEAAPDFIVDDVLARAATLLA